MHFLEKKPFLIVVIGDSNEKATNLHKNDTNYYEGLKVVTITPQFGLL